MKKRAQGGEVIKYMIIAVVIISVIFFGFFSVTKVKNKLCETDMARFKLDMMDLDKTVKKGTSKEMTITTPCGVDEIYFADLNDEINLELLDENPILRDSIESKAETNVFLLKDGNLVDSFYAGNLDLDHPDFLCMLPSSEKINFFLEGKGSSISIIPGCAQPECTYIPVDTEDRLAATIIQDAFEFGSSNYCVNCPKQNEDPTNNRFRASHHFDQFVQTQENVRILRKIEYCKETDTTNVEIIIAPEDGASLKSFIYYEYIPKECIADVTEYLNTVFDDTKVDVIADPLIIWDLDDIEGERRISYELETLLSGSCKDTIAGLGVALKYDPDRDGGKEVNRRDMPSVSTTNNGIPTDNNVPEWKTNFPASLDLSGPEGFSKIMITDLSNMAIDKETPSKELGYSVKTQSNEDLVRCKVDRRYELVCEVAENERGYSLVTLETFDGQASADATLRIDVEVFTPPTTCGNNICEESNGEDCTNCPGDCPVCSGISGPVRNQCKLIVNHCLDNDVCPAGTKIGDTTSCDCSFGIFCKKEFQCEVTTLSECSLTPTCPSGYTVGGQVPCTLAGGANP